MIAEDHGDLGLEFAGLLALQQILKTMRQARSEQCNFRDMVAEMDLELHAELLGQGRKRSAI